MLDGLLGRGFAAKCKSLIKLTKSRIDVIRRKRSATLKFLKKDVADLLANGLDINAYGRAEGLVGELVLSSCYDFVERCFDLVLKHLSVLQKMRHCAEDCREAVSSLMFAAARFSDLPELRDLRQLFLERYGDFLELYVNQGFVDNMSAKPVTMEKKVQLLRDVASEFSIRWDSTGFEQRVSRPSTVKAQPRTYGSSLAGSCKSDLTNGKDNIHQGVKRDIPSKAMQEQNDNHGFGLIKEEKPDWKREIPNPPHQRNEVPSTVNKLQNGGEKEATLRKIKYESPPARPEVPVVKKHELHYQATLKTVGLGSSSQGTQHASMDDRPIKTPPKAKGMDATTQRKPEPSPSYAVLWSKVNSKDPLTVKASAGQHPAAKTTRDAQEDEAQKLKSFYNNAIPPPYTRPNTKPKDTKSAANVASPSTVSDTDAVDTSKARQRINHGYRSENNDPGSARGADEHVFDTKVYYQGETVVNPIPKPRSSTRRRHHKSQTSHDDAGVMESAGVVKRKSRNRTRKDDSRRGLQILFDDEQHQNDEEEKIIDKLLIHYSKKPTAYEPEPGKFRRKSSRSSSRHHSRNPSTEAAAATATRDESVASHPSRSFSLPKEQPSMAPPQGNKVFTRAATLEPDRSAAARHVHPKLPDYDDLTARFAALKGR